MGWGKNEVLIAENGALKREVELLREQLTERREDLAELSRRLINTQEALIAKEAPEAYRDQKDMEAAEARDAASPEEKDFRQKQAQRADIAAQYMNEMEKPLFKDAADMQQLLTRAVGAPTSGDQSLHGNEES